MFRLVLALLYKLIQGGLMKLSLKHRKAYQKHGDNERYEESIETSISLNLDEILALLGALLDWLILA